MILSQFLSHFFHGSFMVPHGSSRFRAPPAPLAPNQSFYTNNRIACALAYREVKTLILATKANIWCTIIFGKWGCKHLLGNTLFNLIGGSGGAHPACAPPKGPNDHGRQEKVLEDGQL